MCYNSILLWNQQFKENESSVSQPISKTSIPSQKYSERRRLPDRSDSSPLDRSGQSVGDIQDPYAIGTIARPGMAYCRTSPPSARPRRDVCCRTDPSQPGQTDCGRLKPTAACCRLSPGPPRLRQAQPRPKNGRTSSAPGPGHGHERVTEVGPALYSRRDVHKISKPARITPS